MGYGKTHWTATNALVPPGMANHEQKRDLGFGLCKARWY